MSAAGGVTGADAYQMGYATANFSMAGSTIYCVGQSINGYNGASVYGTSNATCVTGCGYGASGAAITKSRFATGGQPGEVCSGIFDIEAGQQVACTVGKGGTGATAGTIESNNEVYCYPGADGVIILQYLGESI